MKRIYLTVFGLYCFLAFVTLSFAQTFQADSKVNVKSYIVANNTTALVVKATSGALYTLEAFNNSATIAYVKLYDAATATCGSGTPVIRYMIPANASGAGYISPNVNGTNFPGGITMCVTTGIADNNTGSPAATTYLVNVHYK